MSGSKAAVGKEIAMILLDPMDRRPIYEQIVEKMSELMITGVLGENSPLPSVRNMAAELSINPNTVQRAYIELERKGYIYSVKGKGSFVSPLDALKQERREVLFREIKGQFAKARQAGIEEERLTAAVHEVYAADAFSATSDSAH